MFATYNIVSGHPFLRTIIEADVIPTPRLLSEGHRPVEAYRFGETERGKGLWRVRDDGYDPEGTEYQLVCIERIEPKEW